MILGLKDAHGQWNEEPPDVKRIILDYFSQLFQSSTPDEGIIDEAIENLTPCVSPTMSQQLSLPYNFSKVLFTISHVSFEISGAGWFSDLIFQKILAYSWVRYYLLCAEIS